MSLMPHLLVVVISVDNRLFIAITSSSSSATISVVAIRDLSARSASSFSSYPPSPPADLPKSYVLTLDDEVIALLNDLSN